MVMPFVQQGIEVVQVGVAFFARVLGAAGGLVVKSVGRLGWVAMGLGWCGLFSLVVNL